MGGIKAEAILVRHERDVCVEMSLGVQWAALCMSVQGWELGGGVPGPRWCLAVQSSTVHGAQSFRVAATLRTESCKLCGAVVAGRRKCGRQRFRTPARVS